MTLTSAAGAGRAYKVSAIAINGVLIVMTFESSLFISFDSATAPSASATAIS